MQKLYISILGLCLLACFQLSYANFAAEIGWLVRTWVCQANYQQELQNAQQNNPKAQVVAPKFQNDNDCTNLNCILKTGNKQQQQLPARQPPITVPDYVPCNTKANLANKNTGGKLGPGQVCFSNNGANNPPQCLTLQQVGNIINPPNNGGRLTLTDLLLNGSIDIRAFNETLMEHYYN